MQDFNLSASITDGSSEIALQGLLVLTLKHDQDIVPSTCRPTSESDHQILRVYTYFYAIRTNSRIAAHIFHLQCRFQQNLSVAFLGGKFVTPNSSLCAFNNFAWQVHSTDFQIFFTSIPLRVQLSSKVCLSVPEVVIKSACFRLRGSTDRRARKAVPCFSEAHIGCARAVSPRGRWKSARNSGK